MPREKSGRKRGRERKKKKVPRVNAGKKWRG